jgi:hypothetical protein
MWKSATYDVFQKGNESTTQPTYIRAGGQCRVTHVVQIRIGK